MNPSIKNNSDLITMVVGTFLEFTKIGINPNVNLKLDISNNTVSVNIQDRGDETTEDYFEYLTGYLMMLNEHYPFQIKESYIGIEHNYIIQF